MRNVESAVGKGCNFSWDIPVILAIVAFSVFSCSEAGREMRVSTGTAEPILINGATVTGTIIDLGDGASQYGHCYGTEPDVTTEGLKTQLGKPWITGEFTSEITGLVPETKYYVRAYITDGRTTEYGSEIIFTTPEDDAPGTFTDSRDGSVYARIKIGTQWWMAENLAWLPSVNSSQDYSETTPYYYVYSFDGTLSEALANPMYNTYGVLYNYPAAVNACPPGWHLPSDDEWTTMVNTLIAGGYNFDGSLTGNKLAKAMASVSGWDESFIAGSPGNNDYVSRKNASGFNAQPGGLLIVDAGGAGFDGNGMKGIWWSDTQSTSPNVWTRYIGYEGVSINRYDETTRAYALSIRCVRDN
jgi:uncharacterized protein (TIGR02145 family)